MNTNEIIYKVKKEGVSLADLLKNDKITLEQYSTVKDILEDEFLTEQALELYASQMKKSDVVQNQVKDKMNKIKEAKPQEKALGFAKKNKKKIIILLVILVALSIVGLGGLKYMSGQKVNNYNKKVDEYVTMCEQNVEKNQTKQELTDKLSTIKSLIAGEDYYGNDYYENDYTDDENSSYCVNQFLKADDEESLKYYTMSGYGMDALEQAIATFSEKEASLDKEIEELNKEISDSLSKLPTADLESIKTETKKIMDEYKKTKEESNSEDSSENRSYSPVTVTYKGVWYDPDETEYNGLKAKTYKVFYELSYTETWRTTSENQKELYVFNYTVIKNDDKSYVASKSDPQSSAYSYADQKEELLDEGYKEYTE